MVSLHPRSRVARQGTRVLFGCFGEHRWRALVDLAVSCTRPISFPKRTSYEPGVFSRSWDEVRDPGDLRAPHGQLPKPPRGAAKRLHLPGFGPASEQMETKNPCPRFKPKGLRQVFPHLSSCTEAGKNGFWQGEVEKRGFRLNFKRLQSS